MCCDQKFKISNYIEIVYMRMLPGEGNNVAALVNMVLEEDSNIRELVKKLSGEDSNTT